MSNIDKKTISINYPCIQDIIIRKNETDVCFTTSDGQDETKLFLKEGEDVMFTVNIGDVSKIGFGGTDNWGKDYLPLYLDYSKKYSENDSILVDNITLQQYAGDGNWCKCVKKSSKVVQYITQSENPYNVPRTAYFYHKTTDDTIKRGYNAGRPAAKEWCVTVIQKANPNGKPTSGETVCCEIKGENDIQCGGTYNYTVETCNDSNDLGKLSYKVGLISDIHFDYDDNNGSQYADDMKNALEYFNENGVEFIASPGDMCQYNDKDYAMFNESYTKYGKNIRYFTCIGNHDFMRLFSYGKNAAELSLSFRELSGEGTYKDMKFFEYNGKWDEQRVGTRNVRSKMSYWIEMHGDIYVFLSLDYGEHKYTDQAGYTSQAMNKLDYNDKYTKQILPFAVEGGYEANLDKNFDYQFYNPNSLIWLKDIIENNTDKRVFVFTHHFFPQKSGNGTSYSARGYFYSKNRIYPYNGSKAITSSTTRSGANTLCGMQFYFLNYLNNKYRNVVWFTGHSHFHWNDEKESGDKYINFCNNDFEIVKPLGTEHYNNPNDNTSISSDWRNTLYTRKSDNPTRECGWNIHLPSLAKPSCRKGDAYSTLYAASEGAIMEVYEKGVIIKEVVFKTSDDSTYINRVVGEKNI